MVRVFHRILCDYIDAIFRSIEGFWLIADVPLLDYISYFKSDTSMRRQLSCKQIPSPNYFPALSRSLKNVSCLGSIWL